MTNGYFYNILNAKGYVLVHGMLQQVASAADAKEIVALQLFLYKHFVHEHNYAIYIDQPVSNPLESSFKYESRKTGVKEMKKILASILASAMVFSLSACGRCAGRKLERCACGFYGTGGLRCACG